MAIVCARSSSGTTSWSSSCSSSARPLLAIVRSVLASRCCSSALFDSSSFVSASSSTVSSSVPSSSSSRAPVKSSDRVEVEASSFNLRFGSGRDPVNADILESRGTTLRSQSTSRTDACGTAIKRGEREAGKVEDCKNVSPSSLRPARNKSANGYSLANPFEAIAGHTFMEVSRLCSTLMHGPQKASSYPSFGTNILRPAPADQAQQLRFTSSSSHRRLSASPDLSVGTSVQDKLDPFALVADELAHLGHKLRSMVAAEVPTLAAAAEYFFKLGVEGKRFRPMVLLLMASSLTEDTGLNSPAGGQRVRQQRIAEITEMIHVASLLHDDVLDHADTRRGISSLNHVMGNKLAVLAGDFLLSRASVALASLHNIEVVELLSKVLEHLVTGEIMQLTTETREICSMEYYMQKTFYKTASLMANSCKSIAILADQPREVANLAFEYGRHLGLAFQLVDDSLDFVGTKASLGKPTLSDLAQGIATAPVLFALEEHPRIYDLVKRKFRRSGDIDQALEMVRNSDGILKTQQLAANHAHQAALAVASLPPSSSERVQLCRRALTELTQQVITRSK